MTARELVIKKLFPHLTGYAQMLIITALAAAEAKEAASSWKEPIGGNQKISEQEKEIDELNDEIVRLEAECDANFAAGMQHAMAIWERWIKVYGTFSYRCELQTEIDRARKLKERPK